MFLRIFRCLLPAAGRSKAPFARKTLAALGIARQVKDLASVHSTLWPEEPRQGHASVSRPYRNPSGVFALVRNDFGAKFLHSGRLRYEG